MSFESSSGSFSNPGTGAQSGLGGFSPDVQSALGAGDGGLLGQAITPLNGAEAAAAGAHANISAEVASLSGKAIAAVGNAAIAAVPLGGEPISPLIQLIMKMPGGLGVACSFLEWITNFFTGGDLIKLFDPAFFQASIGSALHNLATGAQQFTISIGSTMSGNSTSLMSSIGQVGHHVGGSVDLSKLSVSAEHFTQNPANIGAQADLSKMQFEGAHSPSISHEGTVAGPSVSGNAQSNYLAGNQRLFSDRIGSGGGNFSSVTSATNVPATTGIPNNSGATFGHEGGAMAARVPDGAVSGPSVGNSNMQIAGQAQPTLESASSASSSISDRLGSNNLIASDVPAYRPSMSSYWAPNATQHVTGSGSMGSGSDFIEPLKAKQLSFSDMQKSSVSPSQSMLDHIAKQSKGAAGGASRVTDSVGHHASLPKAYSTSSGSSHVTSHSAHHATGPRPAAHHAPQARPAQQYAQQEVRQLQQQTPEQNQLAQGTDQTSPGQPTDQAVASPEANYTVQRGDNLWNIAQKNLGDGSKWTEIYKMNADTLGSNPDLIFSGTELKLPGVGQQIADAGKYVVQPGDNLWNIAQKQMGSGTSWGDLYKANADVIGGNPSLIQPGQELSMPGASETIAQANPAMNSAQAAVPQSMPSAQGLAQAQTPIAQSGFGMDATQMQMQQPIAQQPMMQQAPAMQQTQMMQQSAPMQGMQSAAPAVDTVSMSEGIPVSPSGVIQVQPAQEIPMGPGSAGAATLKPGSDSVVSSSLAPDMSWLHNNSNKP